MPKTKPDSTPSTPAEPKVSTQARLFAALGDETRLAIVQRLSKESPQSISRLTEGTDVTRQAITKHLDLLEQANLIHSDRQGRERLFHLNRPSLTQARQSLDAIAAQWDDALSRLKHHVESRH